MHIFYCPQEHLNYINLDRSESHHCINVLRFKEQDIINVMDGKGTMSTARILKADPEQVKLEILSSEKKYGKKDYYLHIAIAPPKNIARFEWFLEKSTEIGIDEISPVFTNRSERLNLRSDRLNKIMLAAVKQSRKAYLPVLNRALPYTEFVAKQKAPDKFIAYCGNEVKDYLINIKACKNNILVLIGPEGDFTSDEIELALDNAFIPVSLGNNLLRTETAGVVAAQIIADQRLIANR